MKKIPRKHWNELRDAAWEWDPIGLGKASRALADSEYDCLVEQIVPLLQRGADVPTIVAHFDKFLPEHFGLLPQPGADSFAEAAIAWWKRVDTR